MRRTDPSSVDDVCAGVWEIAWRRRDRLPADALPWLLTVARRVLWNHSRGTRRLAALRQRLVADGARVALPPDVPSDRPLREALAQLSASDRELVLLLAWEGLTHAQAAAALRIRPGAFAVRLHRARNRLARALADQGNAGPASSDQDSTAPANSSFSHPTPETTS
jgi:RNA polymerase sigma-70 factor, ECF subfamily